MNSDSGMKKFLLSLIALALVATSSLFAYSTVEHRQKIAARVETCDAILEDFQMDLRTAIPAAVWAKAKAVIITNQLKAGAVLGFNTGWGVIMVKKPTGWSVPAMLSANEASFGLQLGVNTVETIYIITDDNTPKLLFNNRFNVGIDAKAVAGPHAAEAEKINKALIATPVLVYGKRSGFYAGATVKTGQLTKDDESNRILYSTGYTLPEILYGNWIQPIPEVSSLMRRVQQLAP